ncbi:MAG: pimeloyl-ACP methyl esterase BioG family protein [Marinifilaceae bacterium]
MKQEWIKQEGHENVIIFFNGWGMDHKVIAHLEGDFDILMCYNYKDIKQVTSPNVKHYTKIYLVAWSMGVWAATQAITKWGFTPHRSVAINGTSCPIDNCFGIPQRVYLLTERTMSDKGRKLFTERMFTIPSECEKWSHLIANRGLIDVCEELTSIREQWNGIAISTKWDKIIVAQEDAIFPTKNLLAWAETQEAAHVIKTAGGHYLWHTYTHWNELID